MSGIRVRDAEDDALGNGGPVRGREREAVVGACVHRVTLERYASFEMRRSRNRNSYLNVFGSS